MMMSSYPTYPHTILFYNNSRTMMIVRERASRHSSKFGAAAARGRTAGRPTPLHPAATARFRPPPTMSRGRQLAVGIAAAGMIIATIAFLASTRLPLAPSAELQSGLPVGDDWPCEVPKASSIMLNGSTDISKPDPNCDQYQKYSYAETFTYVQVAEAWAAAGLNPKYCPAAVVIAAGECVPLNPPHVGGCNLKSTGASGLYQTDWVREAEDNPNIRKVVGDDWKERIRNPCENSRYVWGTMFPPAPPISYNGVRARPEHTRHPGTRAKGQLVTDFARRPSLCLPFAQGCFTGDFPIDQKYTPPLRIECDTPELCPAAGAGSRCDWNFSLGHCDWLGPFCHWQVRREARTGGAAPPAPPEMRVAECAALCAGRAYMCVLAAMLRRCLDTEQVLRAAHGRAAQTVTTRASRRASQAITSRHSSSGTPASPGTTRHSGARTHTSRLARSASRRWGRPLMARRGGFGPGSGSGGGARERRHGALRCRADGAAQLPSGQPA